MKDGWSDHVLENISAAMCKSIAAGFALCMVGLSFPAYADDGDEDASTNDYGGIGLLQTRTARFAKDGQYEIGASYVNPHRRYYMNWQILSWLEVVFRYSDIRNSANGLVSRPSSEKEFWSDIFHLRNNRSFLDRSFDFKFKLMNEGKYRPALAVGLQDAIGTGVWSSEYVVASKRYKDFDFTLGMGWGYMGGRGGIKNPLRLFGSSFSVRDRGVGRGGKLSTTAFFRGRTVGLFGGVEYRTPVKGLNLKLEYDGADPQKLAQGGRDIKSRTPFNVGLRYRAAKYFDVTLGVERGTSVMLHLALRADLYGLGLKKKDIPRPDVIVRHSDPAQDNFVVQRDPAGLHNVSAMIKAEGYGVASIDRQADNVMVVLKGADRGIMPEDQIRLAEKMFNGLDRAVLKITLSYSSAEQGYVTRSIHRDDVAMAALIDAAFDLAMTHDVSVYSLSLKADALSVEAVGQGMASNLMTVMAVQVAANVSRVKIALNGAVKIDNASIVLETTLAADALFNVLEKESGPVSQVRIVENVLEVITPEKPTRALPVVPVLASVESASFIREADDNDAERLKTLAEAMFADLRMLSILGSGLEINGTDAVVYLARAPYRQKAKNIGRAATVAANHLPSEVETITVVDVVAGMEVSRVRVLRSDLERHAAKRGSAEETSFHTEFLQPVPKKDGRAKGYQVEGLYPSKGWWLTPALSQHVGDPEEGIYRANVDLELGAFYSPMEGLNLTFVGRRSLFGTLDGLSRKSNSVLPHVRSDIVEYSQGGKNSIYRLQADYSTQIKPNWYARVSAGLLEQMFGGVGGEVLYKPYDKPWGVSVDATWVKQRGYKQRFGFRDYSVVTGHATFYYDLPFHDMRAVVSVGRYLAKDYGTTIDISRRFKNGVRVGGFATFTNVPAWQFGEGSFDKGFYISLPMELFLTRPTRQQAFFAFRPLTRDGGQKVAVGPRMFDVVDGSSPTEIMRDWGFFYD